MAAYRDWLSESAKADAFNGVVLLAEGDTITFREAYGFADRRSGEKLTPTSKFRIASLSKQFTAVAIFRLQDQRVLRIDDSVCQWVSPCPSHWRAITLKHLLTHSSGIPDLMARSDWAEARWALWTPARLTEASARLPLAFKPGERAGYSNAGYNLLGQVIENATGEPFADHIRRTLLEPLGMRDSGLAEGDFAPAGLAQSYVDDGAGLRAFGRDNLSVVFAAGALYSTVDDLLVWTRALHGGELLTAGSYAQFIAADASADNIAAARDGVRRIFGCGVFIGAVAASDDPPVRELQIFHSGSWGGFRAFMTYLPHSQSTAIVLMNDYRQPEAAYRAAQVGLAHLESRGLKDRLNPQAWLYPQTWGLQSEP